ncbi:DUF2182 domain-containing protein [Roseibium polysiphoniae]|uniref:DUF2182 domain-containing protein n=1 Tax=Roseibium polysiphoniae TaxID=2571221 RepID=A0A944CBJ1_9HYPH|nr:DUF2182 domain-containing protein [Roseibium polysiphoniae]
MQVTSVVEHQETQPNALARGWPWVLACLLGLTLAGWLYLSLMVADMISVMDMTEAGPGMGVFNAFNIYQGLPPEARAAIAALCLPTSVATFGMPAETWAAADVAKVFVMWLMMALAMMLPSAIPMLNAYARRQGKQTSQARNGTETLLVAAGYLTVWSGYAVIATGAQWLLTLTSAVTPMMAPASMAFAATILMAAGAYQFTRAKKACLVRCWYPRFAFAERTGVVAAYKEGLVQGLACLGCCWAIMTVMFAVGLMNVIWIVVLGVLMAVEKTLPNNWLHVLIGIIFLGWGLALIALMQAGLVH